MFTMILFCFFSYSSIELIKKYNRAIKEKEKIFFIISFLISIVYAMLIFIILKDKEEEETNIRFYFYKNSGYNFIRFIHISLLVGMSILIFSETFVVVIFMNERMRTDNINSWKRDKLSRILVRYPVICTLYWIFYVVYLPLSKFHKDLEITYILYFFSISFLNLRGFLISLNAVRTSKLQAMLQRFFVIYLRGLILSLDLFGKKKKRRRKKADNKDNAQKNEAEKALMSNY